MLIAIVRARYCGLIFCLVVIIKVVNTIDCLLCCAGYL